MTVHVTPQIEAKIAEMVASGRYSDADAVIDTAIRLLEERERKLNRLRAELAIGEAQERRGDLHDLTPERFEEIKQRARENVRNGKSIKDAVKP
ncbi:MAG: type II toxin-antitoxin system ParD family antitoxin [Thermomicrobiales bacterium]